MKTETNTQQDYILSGLKHTIQKEYPQAAEKIKKAYELASANNSLEDISVCLSIFAFLNYSQKTGELSDVLLMLDDADYMAGRSESVTAHLVNELVRGNINFCENVKDVALIHYNNALKLSTEIDKYNLSDNINTRIKQLQNGMDYSLPTQTDPLVSLVKISQSITALTDIDELLHVIAQETKNAMQADRCT